MRGARTCSAWVSPAGYALSRALAKSVESFMEPCDRAPPRPVRARGRTAQSVTNVDLITRALRGAIGEPWGKTPRSHARYRELASSVLESGVERQTGERKEDVEEITAGDQGRRCLPKPWRWSWTIRRKGLSTNALGGETSHRR